MTLIITTEQEQCLTVQQGVITMPREDGTVACSCSNYRRRSPTCPGIRLSDIPVEHQVFANHLKLMGGRFVERKKIRGYEPVGSELWVHGPFNSYRFNERLADVESSLWREATAVTPAQADGFRGLPGDSHPEKVLPFVFERDAFEPYVDYIFLGYFLHPETVQITRRTDTGNDRSGFIPAKGHLGL